MPAEMTALLKRMQKLRQTNNHYEHVLADCMFHRAMVAGCGNAVLAETYDSLRSRQSRVAMKALCGSTREEFSVFSPSIKNYSESLIAH